MRLRPLSTRAIVRAVVVIFAIRLAMVHCGSCVSAEVVKSTGTPTAAAHSANASKPGEPEKLLKEDPLLKAIALGDKGRLDDSAAAILALIKAKDNAAARNALGVVRVRQGDKDAAITEFGVAIKLNAKFADAWFNRAALRAEKGDVKGALSDYEKVITLKPAAKGQLEIATQERERLAQQSPQQGK